MECLYPDCNGKTENNSKYCCKHECANITCSSPRVKEDSLYCFNHKCIVCEGLRRHEASKHCKLHSLIYWVFG